MARWSERVATASVPQAADRHRTAAGKCFLDMLGVFAEFETNLRRERQLEGIAKARPLGSIRAGHAMSGRKMKPAKQGVGN
jgi:DNA invertase Pin-like site-specific DNA recombinase